MTYQRGTDLLNCFGICDNFRCNSYPMGAELSCLAKPTDTCPREQAEKDPCNGYSSTIGIHDASHIAAYSPDHALLIKEFIEAHAEFVRAHASLDAFHRYSVALDNLNHYRKERGIDG